MTSKQARIRSMFRTAAVVSFSSRNRSDALSLDLIRQIGQSSGYPVGPGPAQRLPGVRQSDIVVELATKFPYLPFVSDVLSASVRAPLRGYDLDRLVMAVQVPPACSCGRTSGVTHLISCEVRAAKHGRNWVPLCPQG